MARWALYCTQARNGNAPGAARQFLAEAAEKAEHGNRGIAGAVLKLINIAAWRDEEVAELEANGLCLPVIGQFGTFFFAAPGVPDERILRMALQARISPGPRISPSGLVALARAVVDVLGKS